MKHPEAGKVKTRLGKDIGHERAVKVYQKLIDHTRAVALQMSLQREVWYGAEIRRDDQWPETHFQKKLQSGRDLGERMANAFRSAFADGARKVLIIGSDCPELSKPHLVKALNALDYTDVCLGPARDGGYYLLGLNSEQALFEAIPWSTAKVFSKTLEKIREKHLSYYLLPELSDLDTLEDLKNFPAYDAPN